MKRCRGVSKSSKSPNPLFEKWLDEWRIEAANRNSELQHALARALSSLRKYPIELKSGEECLILQNFGVNLCARLDKKLAEYKKNRSDLTDRDYEHPDMPHTATERNIRTPKNKELAKNKNHQSRLNPKDNEEKSTVKVPSTRHSSRSVCGTSNSTMAINIRLPQSCFVDEFELETISTFKEYVFVPGEFQIILLIDTQENSKLTNQFLSKNTLTNLHYPDLKHEVRRLNLGDFAWIVRNNNGEELMLPYIVERKRMDDFAGSIKDGRFHEQKFRLRLCGIPNVIFMVEKFGKGAGYGLPSSTLQQAIVNTEMVDKFFVKFTSDHEHSMTYLCVLTNLFTKIFEQKTLISCSKENLSTFVSRDDTVSLLPFQQFSQFSAKNKNLKPREMFIKHLIQLHGMSVEKAFAITERYPTLRHLIAAFRLAEKPELLLSTIPHGTLQRNIGPSISKTIFKLYSSAELK